MLIFAVCFESIFLFVLDVEVLSPLDWSRVIVGRGVEACGIIPLFFLEALLHLFASSFTALLWLLIYEFLSVHENKYVGTLVLLRLRGLLGATHSGVLTFPESKLVPTHVRNIWAIFGLMYGINNCSVGDGCKAIAVKAKSVRGPHSLE